MHDIMKAVSILLIGVVTKLISPSLVVPVSL